MVVQRMYKAIEIKTRKMMLLGLTLWKALVEKAWSKACQMMMRREREASLLKCHSRNNLRVCLGKMFWTIWPMNYLALVVLC